MDAEGFVEWDNSPPMEWDEYAAICEANYQYEQALAKLYDVTTDTGWEDESDESMPTWTKKELRDEYRAMIADRKERERNEY